MNRYQELFRIEDNYFLAGSPVLIEKGALLKDLKLERLIAQLKIKNLSEKTIISCKIKIQCLESNNNKIEKIVEHQYLDIEIRPQMNFGEKNPILITENITRKFIPAVTEVVFSDNSIWQNNNLSWENLPEFETLQSFFNDFSLFEQFQLETSSQSKFVPKEEMGLFLCSCGNISTHSTCPKCHCLFQYLILALDKNKLRENADIRLEKQAFIDRENKKQEEKELLEKKSKQDKTKKILARISAIIIILLLGIALITKVIIPKQKQSSEYKKAMNLLSEENFDDAIDSFTSLDNYKDSRDMVDEANYLKCLSLINSNSTEDDMKAIKVLERLGDYKDSNSLLETLKNDLYISANSLYDKGQVKDAISIFESLGDYKDSMKIIMYANALKLKEHQKLEEAIEIFDDLGNFKDSLSKKESTQELLEERIQSETKDEVQKAVSDFNGFILKQHQKDIQRLSNTELLSVFPNDFSFRDSNDTDYFLLIFSENGYGHFRYEYDTKSFEWKIDGDFLI